MFTKKCNPTVDEIVASFKYDNTKDKCGVDWCSG